MEPSGFNHTLKMQEAGLYIHIPFCEKKCGYCDFYSITHLDVDVMDNFIQALILEMRLRNQEASKLKFKTVFLGGGTPTLLNENHFISLWENLHRYFHIESGGEFTIEANPGTTNLKKLQFLHDLGFNRISFGVQSFNPAELKFLGRIHTVEEIIQNFTWARQAGFTNINLDLMTAFPGITPQSFEHSLRQALALHPEHISCYTLIFEPGTPFYRKLQQGILHPVSDDEEADYYEQARHFLGPSGYLQYEISNFAYGEEYRCQHNLIYWHHQPYLGLGPSAHSFLINQRRSNIRSVSRYINLLREGELPIDFEENLSEEDLIFEHIFLRLRLREGIDLNDFRERFGFDFANRFKNQLLRLAQENLIQQDESHICLTETGMLLADSIATYF